MGIIVGQFIDSIKSVKENYGKYDEWEQKQADERAKKEYLSRNTNIPKDKLDLTTKKSQTVIRATEILDKYSEDNCEDVEQATNMAAGIVIPIAMLPTQFMTVKNPMKGTVISTLIGLGITCSFILWGNSKQKEASRIGRFQAMQKDLNDTKNFVIYTPEQIKEAEENAKKVTVDKDKNNLFQSIKNLIAIHKDKKAYKEWASNKDKEAIEKLKNRKLTKEQIQAAKDDKELIVDTVKEINIKAEEYSENVENAFDTISAVSFLLSAPAGFLINKALGAIKSTQKYKTIAAVMVPILTDMAIMAQGTMAQKEAARVGRYEARKDLSENPARLMSYSDAQMTQAKDIKAPNQKKSLSEKLSQSFSFLNKYYDDRKEYKNYRETEQVNLEKMQKALSDVKITDKQRIDAENLQKKVFMAFEEIDEMSQRYSEDVEAGSEIAKNVISNAWGLGIAGALFMAGSAVSKGKFPITNIVNKLTNLGLKEDSTLRVAINNFYKALKENNLTEKFQSALVNGFSGITKFAQSEEAKPLKEPLSNLAKETGKIFNPMILAQENGLQKALEPHLKQGAIAKWFRNLLMEGADIYTRFKISSMPGGEHIANLLPKKEISDYKTVIGTTAVAGLPVLGSIFAVPYAVNSWFTDIQKKAGKIGIMKAMEKIDDPRVFADDKTVPQKNVNTQNTKIQKTQNDNNIFSDFQNFV